MNRVETKGGLIIRESQSGVPYCLEMLRIDSYEQLRKMSLCQIVCTDIQGPIYSMNFYLMHWL